MTAKTAQSWITPIMGTVCAILLTVIAWNWNRAVNQSDDTSAAQQKTAQCLAVFMAEKNIRDDIVARDISEIKADMKDVKKTLESSHKKSPVTEREEIVVRK